MWHGLGSRLRGNDKSGEIHAESDRFAVPLKYLRAGVSVPMIGFIMV